MNYAYQSQAMKEGPHPSVHPFWDVVYPNWGSPALGDLAGKEVTNPAPESELTLRAGCSRFRPLDEDLVYAT